MYTSPLYTESKHSVKPRKVYGRKGKDVGGREVEDENNLSRKGE